MKTRLLALLACAGALGVSACGASPAAPRVPSLATSGPAAGGSAAAGGSNSSRAAALHAAAECIRQHGVPTYKDPVLTGDGHVYTDARSIQDADQPTMQAVEKSCGALIATAGFQPDQQDPAPPKLVQAGVKAAECLRANGLTKKRDPTASSPFVPGHGFGNSQDEMPAGGKTDPVWQRAATACRSVLDEEIRLSSLGSLANG